MHSILPAPSPNDGPLVLIAALSGRALAQAAARSRYRPLVADLFADLDTCELAEDAVRVAGSIDSGFDDHALIATLRRLAAGRSVEGLVYGSGFEARPDLLAAMAQAFALLGNRPAAVERVKDPVQFATLCHDLAIPHPAIALAPPQDPGRWLRKRRGASGGQHVGWSRLADPGCYWQAFVHGRTVSLSFLGDGRRAEVLAATEQWPDGAPGSPFRFGGIARPARIADRLENQLARTVARLTEALGLVGLNSADFLVSADAFTLLEVNPRPGAALDVLDDRDGCLFHWHIAACRGRLPGEPARFASAAAAARVVYARHAIAAVPAIDWPDWTADRQPPDTFVPSGAPLCTVVAKAQCDVKSAIRLVEERATAMLKETASDAGAAHRLSVNDAASRMVARMVAKAEALRIAPARGAAGELLIDCGTRVTGGIAAGLWLAAVCMGGLGRITVAPDATYPNWPFSITVRSSQPVIGCLASQYAGWKLEHDGFMAMGSGPARALAGVEQIYRDIGYADDAETATLVLEADGPPPAAVIAHVAETCRVEPSALTILYAPTRSQAGSVQIVARSLEVALHKAHAVAFPLERITDGIASAPFAPPHPDFLQALGRTNDAIIYGARVWLFVTGPAEDARALAEQLPSSTSRDHGRPFAEIFRRFDGDFYAIDPMLFSPAEVVVTAIDSGESFRAGRIDRGLLDASFG
jgi:methenyltetrahydromethanopterin cyclohydrolase